MRCESTTTVAKPPAEVFPWLIEPDKVHRWMTGLEVYQPERELDVRQHVQAVNGGPLDDGAVKRLFERIIDEARRLERLADLQ